MTELSNNMFPGMNESYLRHVFRQEFESSHRHGVLNRLWSSVTGRPFQLLDLRQVEETVQPKTQSDVGLQVVSIEQIVGSEGRSHEFDTAWRPLKVSNRERWTDIATAQTLGINMPAVDLIQIGDVYFVRDGHHRISVAKAQGQLEVEANVRVWQLDDMAGATMGDRSAKTDPTQPTSIAAKIVHMASAARGKLAMMAKAQPNALDALFTPKV